MKNKKISLGVATALMALTGSVMAQVSPVRPAYVFPETGSPALGMAAVPLGDGPLFFAPFAGIAVGRDDNILLSPNNELDSGFAIYTAGVKFDARSERSVFQLGYVANIGKYNSSEEDDYVDQTLRSTYDFAFSPRSFLRVGYDYLRAHDPRGSTDRGISNQVDKYKLSSPSVTYAYGAPNAQGRFEAYYNYADRQYLNNRETTAASDRTTNEYGGAFYWRVMPKTSLLVEARHTELDYKLSTSQLDSEELRYYIGATWDATAATSGTIKVGRVEKKFDCCFPTAKDSSWEGIITWLPRTYSRFDFYSSRQPTESTGLGSFILTDASGVLWTHNWNSVVWTEIGARYQKDKYQGFDRKDETSSVGLKVGYKFRRWLTLGAEYQYFTRDSNLPQYDYDRNLYMLTATGSL